MEQLLSTKLFIPLLRPELVNRPHLIEQLNGGLHRKLTLVSAPAGFGKSTLLTEWVNSQRSDTSKATHEADKIAWISLDESDNDPVRFLAYIITALNRMEGLNMSIGTGALSMLQTPQSPPSESILTALINDLATVSVKVILVLDDYHVIEASSVNDMVSFLLEHLPQQMHLVIATREDPQLPLPRLRARGQLAEIRATDLRFDASEAADFLNTVMKLNLSSDDVAALENRTEGWIAGLHLAAISMQGHNDPSRLIESFTGSHRLVLDYLIEEVLEQQPERVQAFLLQTSILNQFCGDLCDVLTGETDGQETLAYLDKANLFVIPLDEDRHWYRYHHLFADLLRQRMQHTYPERLADLHRRASDWYSRNEATHEATEHALICEDFQRAAQLINNQIDALWERGEHVVLRRWIERFPESVLLSEPQLAILHAYYLQMVGNHEAGEYFFQTMENHLASQSTSDHTDLDSHAPGQTHITGAETLKLEARIHTLRALIASFNGKITEMIHHANKALEHLPEHATTWRSLAAFALGDAYSFMGNMTDSYRVRAEALRACEAAGNVYYTIVANLKLVATLREQGELPRATDICRQQVEMAGDYGLLETVAVGCLRAVWGEMLAELNQLDEALHQTMLGSKIADHGANIMMLGFSYFGLIRVLFSSGDLESGQEIINRVTWLDHETTLPAWITTHTAVWQARIWLANNHVDAASDWARSQGMDAILVDSSLDSIDFFSLYLYVIFARILIAERRFETAIELLQRLETTARGGQRTACVIEILMLQAVAYQSSGDSENAMQVLDQTLALAKPGGFTRIFIDEGPQMAQLLYEALSRYIAPEYVRRLLAAFPDDEKAQQMEVKTQSDTFDWVEPLSERELQVLHLVAEGLTNPDIADRLFLSPHTIKVHTRNIYEKLGVHNRTQAVIRARGLGILSSD